MYMLCFRDLGRDLGCGLPPYPTCSVATTWVRDEAGGLSCVRPAPSLGSCGNTGTAKGRHFSSVHCLLPYCSLYEGVKLVHVLLHCPSTPAVIPFHFTLQPSTSICHPPPSILHPSTQSSHPMYCVMVMMTSHIAPY